MITRRVSTGIPDLDTILDGGFLANSINLLMGPPGTGKTILAEQIVFANASSNARALYLTTFSEPLDKIVGHGQSYAFFEPSKVGTSVVYEDLGMKLREQGITALPKVVGDLFTRHQPKIIVIDSLKALSELGPSPEARRMALFDLATLLTNLECTSFFLGEYAPEMMTDLPEFAIADAIVQFKKQNGSGGEQKFLRVEKLRGSASIPGLHAFSITSKGIHVFPRLLTPEKFSAYHADQERISSGIEGLDKMIETGLWRGSTTMVAGPTGSGKTTLGLQFLYEGARNDEPSLFIGFQENPTQIFRLMKRFGWNPDKLMKAGTFQHLYYSPVEMHFDEVAVDLFRRVQEGKVKRVVIDSLNDLRSRSLDSTRFGEYVYAVAQWFAFRNVTCLMNYELSHLFEFHAISAGETSNMADNVILLRFTPDLEMARTIRVVKSRGSAHDQHEHLLTISNKGVIVGRPLGERAANPSSN